MKIRIVEKSPFLTKGGGRAYWIRIEADLNNAGAFRINALDRDDITKSVWLSPCRKSIYQASLDWREGWEVETSDGGRAEKIAERLLKSGSVEKVK